MTQKEAQAEILLEAMPYIEKYQNKILVVKYGGNAMTDETLKKLVMRDMTLLQFVGIKVVLVHGGGPEISQTLKRMGIESRFVGGLRYTDEETAEVVRMVLAGKVNKGLVHMLGALGARAIGLSGIDGRMLLCSKESEELGFVGKIDQVDTHVITSCLDAGYLPVISSVGFDDAGNIYNVNADTAASAIAGALKAESLILMTDVRGLLRRKDDESAAACAASMPPAFWTGAWKRISASTCASAFRRAAPTSPRISPARRGATTCFIRSTPCVSGI